MRTYDTYKDSGISWLGQIPSHWELKPGFSLYHENDEKFDMLSEPTVLSLSYGNIIVKKNKDEGLVPENYSGYQVIKPDYIIIRCTDLQNDKVSLRTGIAKNHGIITGAYLGLIANEDFNAQYLHYFLHDWDITKEIYRHGSGLRQVLSWNDMKRLPILVPPRVEQEAIVAYLDSATAEIDKAIASQQRMVDLLQERKQIIINQAVTQGLNPDAPMKPTNIDWLPQIPAHWKLKKIKYVVLLKSGQNLTSEQIEKEDLYPVYGGNGLRGYYSDYNNDGDYVLIGRQGALCGNINYAHNKFWATEHAVVCYPVNCVNVLWLGETLRAMNLNRYATASAQPGLAVENIKGLMMPVPDYKEQNDIADYIEKQTKPIDDSIERCNKMIGALTERKQILINDVITGKIKVI